MIDPLGLDCQPYTLDDAKGMVQKVLEKDSWWWTNGVIPGKEVTIWPQFGPKGNVMKMDNQNWEVLDPKWGTVDANWYAANALAPNSTIAILRNSAEIPYLIIELATGMATWKEVQANIKGGLLGKWETLKRDVQTVYDFLVPSAY